MPCNHRFLNDLYPAGQVKYLFIGTFNPSWDRQNDNANWFYGRRNNDFWFIVPQVLGQQSLMDGKFRTDRQLLRNWCFQNKIGLTDLITEITDAEDSNEDHKNIILSVDDNAFDRFEQIKPTNIRAIINANTKTLCGVYLTRYEHTLLAGGIISSLWTDVKEMCRGLNIYCRDLVTPSRQYRVLTRNQKLDAWRKAIRICT